MLYIKNIWEPHVAEELAKQQLKIGARFKDPPAKVKCFASCGETALRDWDFRKWTTMIGFPSSTARSDLRGLLMMSFALSGFTGASWVVKRGYNLEIERRLPRVFSTPRS